MKPFESINDDNNSNSNESECKHADSRFTVQWAAVSPTRSNEALSAKDALHALGRGLFPSILPK